MRGALCLLLVAGCDGVFGLHELKAADAPSVDASCAWSQLVDTCGFGDPALWQPDVELTSGADANGVFTVFHTLTIDEVDVKVALVQKLYVQGNVTLAVTGARPIAIVSAADITIDGSIRVVGSSRNRSECGASSGANGADDAGGASGGGGGAFGGAGGGGGSGDLDGVIHPAGGPGGALEATHPRLAGGCPGGDGGAAPAATGPMVAGGVGGDGGGAVALISQTQVSIGTTGLVNAPGRGGNGGAGNTTPAPYSTGAGGGGAGGMIYIEAPQVAIAGMLAANGGAGGEGGAGGMGMDGADGTTGDVAAPGGTGASNGGDGGSGASASHPDGYPATDYRNGGGGGGGGSVGRIVIVAPSPNITGSVSPSPSPAP